eukprot:scpid54432/ scgid19890/ 
MYGDLPLPPQSPMTSSSLVALLERARHGGAIALAKPPWRRVARGGSSTGSSSLPEVIVVAHSGSIPLLVHQRRRVMDDNTAMQTRWQAWRDTTELSSLGHDAAPLLFPMPQALVQTSSCQCGK